MKNVHFDDQTLVIGVLDEAEQDKQRKWLSHDDLRAIQLDIYRTFEACRRSYSPEIAEYHCRGLENLTSSHRMKMTEKFVKDIIKLHKEYKPMGSAGLLWLQDDSETKSKASRERALKIAEKDALEARRVYEAAATQDPQDDQENNDPNEKSWSHHHARSEQQRRTPGGFMPAGPTPNPSSVLPLAA